MTRWMPLRAFCAAAFGLVLSVSRLATAEEVELKNDSLVNNSEGKAICGFNIGEGFGVRFTPPAYPAKLLKVSVLMTNVGLSLTACNHVAIETQIPITLEIFKATTEVPGTSLLKEPDLGIGNDTVLNQVDVTEGNVSIDEGAFFVTFTFQTDKASPMIDQGATVGDGNFLYGDIGQGLQWYAFSKLGANAPKGNWAVRATVSVPGADGGGADAAAEAGGPEAGAAGSAGDASVDGWPDSGPQVSPPPESAEGGGCSTSGGPPPAAASAAAMIGIACLLRRRLR